VNAGFCGEHAITERPPHPVALKMIIVHSRALYYKYKAYHSWVKGGGGGVQLQNSSVTACSDEQHHSSPSIVFGLYIYLKARNG
jgi:hypothetical protein